MKKDKKSSLQNRTEGFYIEPGKPVNKKKSKAVEVSRFISEGNPNTQAVGNKEKQREEQSLQNPEQQDDLS